ncbi:MAG TPA: alkaline phosphatase family protein [Acidimicrobiales bacterium]|nr:alkaline phosphatase family protein [Acidimicrobiales bacterium]
MGDGERLSGSASDMTTPSRISRRLVLRSGVGLAAGLAGLRLSSGHARLLDLLLERSAAAAGTGAIEDIDHVVILIQENRSFDHYLGTLSGVRGFSDPAVLTETVNGQRHTVFDQFGYAPGVGPDPSGYLEPFRLVTTDPAIDGECTSDIVHDWGPQHLSWNGGAMDSFVRQHLAANGSAVGPLTMGYYQREDLPFYYALADAFTVCDAYHCSLMGPTDPNRLYSMTGTIDPDGRAGGPLVETLSPPQDYFSFSWTTMPEVLQKAGISWRMYGFDQASDGTNVLYYFKQYRSDPQLAARAFGPTFPEFINDVTAGTLPQVSWLLTPAGFGGHPPEPPALDEAATERVLAALTANPKVWERTVLFVTWDENGGFFDHVPPPTAPPGTPGEWLTVKSLPPAAGGIRGPIGLGFRVPLFIVSPLSRGGYVCSDTFDHTSLLRFLETRFDVEVPNLSAWRRSVTGNLTSAFRPLPPDPSLPNLPSSGAQHTSTVEECPAIALGSELGAPAPPPYPVPPNSMPTQEASPIRIRLPLTGSASVSPIVPGTVAVGAGTARAAGTNGERRGAPLEAGRPAGSAGTTGAEPASSTRAGGASREPGVRHHLATTEPSGDGHDNEVIAAIAGGAIALGLATTAVVRRRRVGESGAGEEVGQDPVGSR